MVKEINGLRCSMVEESISPKRLAFLKELLEHNGFEVKTEEIKPAAEGSEVVYNIGVTSMLFNPVIAVYQRLLKTKDGRKVTPDYWNQKTDQTEPNYWDKQKK